MDSPDDDGNLCYETIGRIWPNLAFFMVSVLSAGLYSDLGPAGLWALAAIPLGALLMWRRRIAAKLDSGGFTEVLWPDGERYHTWSSVREIDERPRSLRLVCDDGVIRFGRMFLNRRAVAMAARRAQRGGRAAELRPDEIASRLGGEVVRVRANVVNRATARCFGPLILGILCLACLGLWHDASRGDAEARTVLWGFVPGLAFMWNWLRTQGRGIQRTIVREATADRTGIELDTGVGRFHIPWSDVGGIEHWTGGNLYLSTMAGDFQVQAVGPAAGRFAQAVQRVLDARAAGSELPRLDGVSDSALSLSESDPDAGLERGLSRLD